MAAKVSGAWNLHILTQEMPLDFFILFSSATSVLGSPGQGNHSAANSFLDALAYYRRRRGLPALSINWGAWAEVGAAAERNVGQRFALQGMGTISVQQGLHSLERLLSSTVTQIAVMPVQWPKFMQQFTPGSEPPIFAGLPKRARQQVRIQQTFSHQRHCLLLDHVRQEAFKVLALDPSHSVDLQQPLSEMGLDSLMAVQLRNALGKTLNRNLSATVVFDYPTIQALTDFLAYEVFSLKSPEKLQAELQEDGVRRDDVSEELEKLSQEEMAALLAKRIAGIADGGLIDE
jgi:acyl carrier protein